MKDLDDFLSDLDDKIDSCVSSGSASVDKDLEYLSQPAPNIIEWITRTEYWNVPSTYKFWGQYQHLRDMFNLRCKLCNSQDPEDISCWGKSRLELESETLLVWNTDYKDFVCPKCGNTMREFLKDGVIRYVNDGIWIIGMRAGKSYSGGHVGGYIEHLAITQGIRNKGALQTFLGQERSEWFEVTFAASTATQAQDTIYAKYREMRKNSPWIKKYINWVKKKERKQTGSVDPWKYRQLDHIISDGYLQVRYNRIASDSSGVAGKTRIFSSIDEWSRLQDTESARSAKELYRVLDNSLMTVRNYNLVHDITTLPFGMMFNVTSPLSQEDPAMLHCKRAQARELKKTYWVHCPTWEFNPEQPRSAFDDKYAEDPIGAERDFGANPPNAETPLIDDPLRFWSSIDFNRRPIATFVEEYRSDKTEKLYVASALEFCDLVPKTPHYLFGDAGVSWDSFALVCAHPEWVDAEIYEEGNAAIAEPARGRIEPSGGMMHIQDRYGVHPDSPSARGMGKRFVNQPVKPIVSRIHPGEMLTTVVDFAMRIVPTVERDIWFQCIIDIIQNLKDRINIASVCFDRWSSDSSIQQIRDLGIMSHKESLKVEDFVSFVRLAYNGRVVMLPPDEKDNLDIDAHGNLMFGKTQVEMSGAGVAVVELMRLNRSPDLKKVFNPNKGKKRGIDSDDTAHCVVGANKLVQDSVVDRTSDTMKLREMRKRQVSQAGSYTGRLLPGKRPW